jgi:hypothetical protein
MKTKLYILLLFLSFVSNSIYSQIEKVIVETYYISDQFDSTDTDGGKLEMGSVTYRVYVDLKPGNKLIKIYGDTNHVLKFSSTKPFFNDSTTSGEAQTYPYKISKGSYGQNKVALDTWITLGQSARTVGGMTNYGILKRQDTDGSFIGGTNNNGGSAGIPQGLLTNSAAAMGIPLTTADGMYALSAPSLTFDITTYSGINDPFTPVRSTIFGSNTGKTEFSSRKAFLKYPPGVVGVIPDSNQILIAQLTTKGELAFELNLEVVLNNAGDTVRYVANDDILIPEKKEKKSSFLKYPFPPPTCGCKDANFLEYNPSLECANQDSCLRRIVLGCTDAMACNFDPKANFSVNSLCCYPGSCGGRDISIVCPQVRGNSFDFEIYPNPAETRLLLNVTGGIKQDVSYSIFNSFGSLILNTDLGVSDKITNHEIDLSEINNGLYLIRVNVGGDFLSKQFFKNSK